MRKFAVAALAAPILAAVYLQTVLRRPTAARLGVLFGAGTLVLVAAVWAIAPGRTTAVPSGPEPTALPSAAFRTHLATGHALRTPIQLEFSAPMAADTVAAALRVTPAVDVDLGWDATGTVLTVTPAESWAPSTYYLVTVDRTAADLEGGRLDAAVRAAFLTSAAPTARIEVAGATGSASADTDTAVAATAKVGARVPLTASFVVTVNGAVDPEALERAVRIEPAVEGTVTATVEEVPAPGVAPISRVVFTPTAALAPDTEYTISLDPALTDHEGSPIAAEQLVVKTIGAPSVVRLRPVGAAKDVAVDTNVSVRFDRPMDRAATQAALTVTVDGKAVTGEYAWAENDTVLVLDPAADLAKGIRVVVAVGAGARSTDGLAVREPVSISFTTVAPPPPPPPAPKPTTTAPKPKATPPPSTGGGSVGGGSWAAVETYMLKLLNCNRQGGIVTSSGGCSSPGGSGLAALKLDAGISSRVARPYAKLLATRGICSHFADGNPGTRLRRAGYTSYKWAENIGCPGYSDAYRGALRTELFFQSERSYNGGHWRNLMNPLYDRVGIGIWVYGGRGRIVIDFYRP